MPAQTKKKYGYDVHPSLAMMRSTIAGMKQRTGRTLEEWVELVTKKGPATEKNGAPGSKPSTDSA